MFRSLKTDLGLRPVFHSVDPGYLSWPLGKAGGIGVNFGCAASVRATIYRTLTDHLGEFTN